MLNSKTQQNVVFVIQMPGEHASCGPKLEPSGFTYDPNELMKRKIFYYNFIWRDFGETSSSNLLDMVKVLIYLLDMVKVLIYRLDMVKVLIDLLDMVKLLIYLMDMDADLFSFYITRKIHFIYTNLFSEYKHFFLFIKEQITCLKLLVYNPYLFFNPMV